MKQQPSYIPPKVTRLNSCESGEGLIACKSGSNASSNCVSGSSAFGKNGCLSGSVYRGSGTCTSGSGVSST